MGKKLSILSTLIFFILTSSLSAQIIENYDSKLRGSHQRGWLGSSYTSQVTLDLATFPKSNFKFDIPGGTTIFMNEKLWFHTMEDTLLTIGIDRLKGLFVSGSNYNVEFTALNDSNRLSDLSVKKGYFSNQRISEELPFLGEFDLGKRKLSSFSDFYLSGLVIILLLASIFKGIFPVVLEYFVTPKKLITAEDFSEAGIFQKFFSLDVIFYLLMMSMLLMLNIMMVAYVNEIQILNEMMVGGLNSLFFNWMLGSVILVFLFILKFIVLKILVAVFDLGKYEFSHFFYLLRLLSISLFLITLAITYFYLNDQAAIGEVVTVALWSFFWVYLIGVTYLFIILVNRVPFKNYHLFAYICTAELIPFLIISKMIIG
ncbi:DUF4271 domain-containing protein [Mongoliibacter ruber]|uniref:Uncharacterized protein DUF4271 n=1 Tax=Mongoliibacter ruber TaxID=1750599 RepID=A0A2T0WRB4_9BACT|nr:DUF4271 domain-containing protein [Mongoliibacter ruber]PRY89230.1 uncharacterized protein DUF4271 [Mongoliibacter ruber]